MVFFDLVIHVVLLILYIEVSSFGVTDQSFASSWYLLRGLHHWTEFD